MFNGVVIMSLLLISFPSLKLLLEFMLLWEIMPTALPQGAACFVIIQALELKRSDIALDC